MNRIYIITLYALFILSKAHAQQVGIGTTQPDASAALEIKSTNKGLLIPRVDLAVTSITTPATGLMVFNTNSTYGNGIGLYINMGTGSIPQWMQLVPNTSGNFIRNQTIPQAGSSFNVSGNGILGGSLIAGSGNVSVGPAITASSSSGDFTSMSIQNTSNNTSWLLATAGNNSPVSGAFSIVNAQSGQRSLIASNNRVGINMQTAPAATLDVNGDIKASGNFLIGMKYLNYDFSVVGNSTRVAWLACPTGYQLISGGGGHRSINTAAKDIRLDYNGPDPSAPSTRWRVIATNTSSSSRTLIIYCNCAKVQ